MVFPSFRRKFISEVSGTIVDDEYEGEKLHDMLVESMGEIIDEYGYAIIGEIVFLRIQRAIYACPDYQDYIHDHDYAKILHNKLNEKNRHYKYILEGFDQCIDTKNFMYDILKVAFKNNDYNIVILN